VVPARGHRHSVEAATEQRQVLSNSSPVRRFWASLELEHVGPTTGVVLSVKPDHAEAALRVIAVCGATRLLSVWRVFPPRALKRTSTFRWR